jgi:broad specificity phosphatase PhoE
MKEDLASKMNSQYKNKAKIVIIRHGSTKLNSEDKIRGWMDLPLDEKGKEEAEKMAKDLKNINLDCLIASDMKRCIQTAEIISDIAGVPIEGVTEAFRPWNVGIHQGKLAEKVIPEMKEYAEEKPNTPIPEGESFNKFKNRFLNGLMKVQKEFKGKKVGIVTHHRGDRIFAAWEKAGMPKDKDVDLDVMFQKGINPGTFRVQGTKIDTVDKAD